MGHINERHYDKLGVLGTGMQNWIDHGIKPGSFLCAVLQNDWFMATRHADRDNLYRFREISDWLLEHAPADCWGSQEKFNAWMARANPCSA